MNQNETKKITKATLKAFIKKNRAKLFVKVGSMFDSVSDGLITQRSGFSPATSRENSHAGHDLGINGVWLVGGSRNSFEGFNADGFAGIRVDNCCGCFTVAIKAAE